MNYDSFPQTALEAIRFFADEENCHSFLASLRWSEGMRCPHCNSSAIGKLSVSQFPSQSKKSPGRMLTRRLWNCKGCKKQFTVKTGTIFENSPVGLEKWLPAVWLLVNAKNGISSYELHRTLGVCQKTAWFMAHRIRLAMREGTFQLSGECEADETFIGGKIRNMHIPQKQKRYGHRKPTGHSAKQPVAGILQRSGVKGASRVVVRDVSDVTKQSLIPHIQTRVVKGSAIYTDSLPSYRSLEGEYLHDFIDHAVEYAVGHVHTNGIENFWSLLKRTLSGTYVRVLPVHLFRYLDEQATRFNERSDDDKGRFLATLQRTEGRRLPWNALTGWGGL